MAQEPRIDAYIAQAAPFAQPILTHLRQLVHATVPGLEETFKWGMPHFVHQGKNLAGFAAFKAHCAFMIHGDGRQGEAMGQFGKLTTLADLPADTELAERLIEACARIGREGTALKPRPGSAKAIRAEIAMPDDFAGALSTEARAKFDHFTPGYRREYLEWITEAKRPETRAKRIAEAAGWIAEGKTRNWKYQNC